GAGLITVIVVWVASLVSDRAGALLEAIAASFEGLGLRLAWLLAAGATVGSLYYSEIADFPACDLCWYQRIALFPLVIILGIAVFRRDVRARVYAIPLAVIGAGLAVYNHLIQAFPNLAAGFCSLDSPCTTAYVWKFNFVSLPLMGLVTFGAIVAVLLLDRSGRAVTPAKDTPTHQEAM
ncbi:MAG TPA: disulfide bond formation protein B, partial [Acidimicrobiia bacterium]